VGGPLICDLQRCSRGIPRVTVAQEIGREQETEKRSARVAEIEPGRASTVNILRGEMSCVGPRSSASSPSICGRDQACRFLTGQWQERPDYRDRVALGSYYVSNWRKDGCARTGCRHWRRPRAAGLQSEAVQLHLDEIATKVSPAPELKR
jgi:hypothetical protein